MRGRSSLARARHAGSALGCLDAIAGETVVKPARNRRCQPEATAAVSYVAAQLALAAESMARRRERRRGQ
jgi:hypothetical protein